MFELHSRIGEVRIVNGKVVVDRNIRRNLTPAGEHVFGHDGSRKIDRWTRPHQMRKKKRTRKNKNKNKKGRK